MTLRKGCVSMFYMPVVREADYPALKVAMGSAIPTNYRGWLRLTVQWQRIDWTEISEFR